MSGFRASLKGVSGILDVQADILTFGKVIGAGMPVGAFAAFHYLDERQVRLRACVLLLVCAFV